MNWYRIEIWLADGRRFIGYRDYPFDFKAAETYFSSRASTCWLGIKRTGWGIYQVTEEEVRKHYEDEINSRPPRP